MKCSAHFTSIVELQCVENGELGRFDNSFPMIRQRIRQRQASRQSQICCSQQQINSFLFQFFFINPTINCLSPPINLRTARLCSAWDGKWQSLAGMSSVTWDQECCREQSSGEGTITSNAACHGKLPPIHGHPQHYGMFG